MIDPLILTAPYLRDNNLNAFGDYQFFGVTYERTGRGTRITKKWFLRGKHGNRVLTNDETREVLMNFFIQNSHE